MGDCPMKKNLGVKNTSVSKPRCQTLSYYNSRVIKDFDEFKKISDVIVANRLSDEIKDVVDKVYTRDLFSRD